MKCQNHLKPFSFEAPDNFLSIDVSFAHFTLLSKKLSHIDPLDVVLVDLDLLLARRSNYLDFVEIC